jgi:hypothetical protein
VCVSSLYLIAHVCLFILFGTTVPFYLYTVGGSIVSVVLKAILLSVSLNILVIRFFVIVIHFFVFVGVFFGVVLVRYNVILF